MGTSALRVSLLGNAWGVLFFALALEGKPMATSRRKILKSSAAGLAGILASGVAPYHFLRNIAKAAEGDTIKVGILHSLSGTIAIIETSLHNAELLAFSQAIEESV